MSFSFKSPFSVLSVTVQTPDGKQFRVTLDANDTIEGVKVKIHEQTGMYTQELRLIFDGKELVDGKTLADYGVEHGAIIHYRRALKREIPI